MFDLHTLGWHAFQQLCHSILRENLGQTVESFLDVHDGGRDGAFTGVWESDGADKLHGKFVIQCKFTNRKDARLKASNLTDEISKVERLIGQGLCDVYILMTNAGISGETDAKVKSMLRSAGVNQLRILGGTWIEQQIRESKNLRAMVPRVYGLGDLSEILDERAYKHAAAVLESMREDLSKVVMTESYRRAATALDKHGFVLLIGEPAAGKTTIASQLAMASADKWGARVVKAANPKEVETHWNTEERSQLFWIDDAFGVTQHESGLVSEWNRYLPVLRAIVNRGSKIVMTSRDYIYQHARQNLKESAFPLFEESQTVVDVHELTLEERSQILYNHLKTGRQNADYRSRIKPFLEKIAQHPRFIPEIARRLAEPRFTSNIFISQPSLDRFVEQRESLLIEVCEKLDADCKAALALVYMRRSRLTSPITLLPGEAEALHRHGSSLGACISALKALEGSFVVHARSDADSFWSFKHPTIGDAYATILRLNPELLGIYVQSAPADRLIWEISCGDVKIEKAVVVPQTLFPDVIKRLLEFECSTAFKTDYLASWQAKRQIKRFLASRCSKDFLEAFLLTKPTLTDEIVQPDHFLDFSEDVDLAVRLFEFGLLPEENRATLAAFATQRALEGNDPRIMVDPGLRALLNDKERSQLHHGLRTVLLPAIDEVRRSLQNSYIEDEVDNPQWHTRRFLQTMDGISSEFSSSRRIQNLLRRQRRATEDWVEEQDLLEQAKSASSDESKRRISADDPPVFAIHGTRSIFDDIDD